MDSCHKEAIFVITYEIEEIQNEVMGLTSIARFSAEHDNVCLSKGNLLYTFLANDKCVYGMNVLLRQLLDHILRHRYKQSNKDKLKVNRAY